MTHALFERVTHAHRFVPYRKPLNTTQYVDSRSNHPPSIIKHIPKSINTRISSLSSDQKAYDQSKPFYEEALKQSNFKETLHYNPPDLNASATPKRKRHRNVIWFNPPYSKSVKTNVGGRFLQLNDKHFPPINPLHKIFNRNTMKIRYSCMPNVKNVISRHNRKILGRSEATKPATSCNCRNQDECPLDNKYQAESIVYKAVVTSLDDGLKKEYIGMTANSFKERYRNHKKSFNLIRYEKETELSKYTQPETRKSEQICNRSVKSCCQQADIWMRSLALYLSVLTGPQRPVNRSVRSCCDRAAAMLFSTGLLQAVVTELQQCCRQQHATDPLGTGRDRPSSRCDKSVETRVILACHELSSRVLTYPA